MQPESTCAEWARAFDQATGEVEDFLFTDGPDNAIAAFRIRFASGYQVLALPSRPRSLRGRQGFVILDDPVKFSTGWYLTEMPPLKRALEDAMLEIPLDAELHSDLRLFTMVDGVVKLPKLKSGERKDRHGDGGITLALAYAASRKRAISYGYAGARDLDRATKRLMRDERVQGRGLW